MSLLKTLKRSYKTIKKHALSSESGWITDNFFILDKAYRGILKNKKALKQTEIYKITDRALAEANYGGIGKAIEELNVTGRDISLFEAQSLPFLAAASALNRLAEEIYIGRESDISVYVKFLINQSGYSEEKIIPLVWSAEETAKKAAEGYGISDAATKNLYRKKIAAYAEKEGMTETEAIIKINEEAAESGKGFCEFIFETPKRNKYMYLSAAGMFYFILQSFFYALSGKISFIAAIPLIFTAFSVADILCSFILKTEPTPRIKEEFIPKSAKTLITVSALLGGEDGNGIFERIENFYYSDPEECFYFCVLADLKDSDERYLPGDTVIFDNAIKKITELNEKHGERFCLFFRERKFNESEGNFGGYERKRGAVCDLVKCIKGGDDSYLYGGKNFIKDIKYIITLDSDTLPGFGNAEELLSAALHPANKPILKDGRIKSGFGIIQPEMKTELESGYKTRFSRLISGPGGNEPYAGASYLRRQTVFGKGSFCGKGIIDVNLFYSLVCFKLPEKKILSHDVIEGSILRTRAATDIVFTDSTPSNACTFYRREHRWIRGDVQNLLFLKGDVLDNFSKATLVFTVLNHLLPLFSVISLVFGCFFIKSGGFYFVLAAYSYILIPTVLSLIRILTVKHKSAFLRFFSKSKNIIFMSLSRAAYGIVASCREAFLALNAAVLAVIRLKTGKKTLEWVTSAQAERAKNGLGKYVLDGVWSVIFGFGLIFFAADPFIKLIGVLWFIYPLVTVYLSEKLHGGGLAEIKLNEKQKNILSVHLRDMWRFYDENIGEETNYLPPDNIQISPVYSVAYRTSPTNIGFYLISLIAARDSGFIDSEILFTRAEKTVNTLEKLEKRSGNLFNWYDIKSLRVIGERYLSSVDSGNFLYMLNVFTEGLKEYSDGSERAEGLIKRCEKIIAESDLSIFYDGEKGLLTVGIRENCEKEKSYYDNLMSESRMTAYYVAAKRMTDKRIWKNMSRTLTRSHGHIGVLSWSGTAFEYFMPQLFLPLYKDSFIYESLLFALNAEKRAGNIWGISESGYWAFDADMNYRYRANGIKELALRKIGKEENVVSPYSSYLSLCISGDCFKNLLSLEKAGMYGKYGMYEALDFDRAEEGVCVKSYMTHHIGMSITACMNALYGGIFIKRAMKDGALKSAETLLREKIPVDAHIFTAPESENKTNIPRKSIKKTENAKEIYMLNRGYLTAIVTENGQIGLKYGDAEVFRTVYEKNSAIAPKIFFTRDGEDKFCDPADGSETNDKNAKYFFETDNYSASHIVAGRDFSGRVRYSLATRGDSLIISTKAESLRKYSVTLAFEPILAEEKEFLSHISFSRLFIESEYDSENKILYFHRRERISGRHIKTLSVALANAKQGFEFSASAAYSEYGGDIKKNSPDGKTGSAITPYCILKTDKTDGGRADFIISVGETKEECKRNTELARIYGGKGKNVSAATDAAEELYSLLYGIGGGKAEKLKSIPINELWAKGISGDNKIILARVAEEDIPRAKRMIKNHLSLKKAFLRYDLIFLTEEKDLYNLKTEGTLKNFMRENGIDEAARGGGIFFIRAGERDKNLISALKATANVYYDLAAGKKYFNEKENILKDITKTPPKNRYIAEKGGGNGVFTENSYITDNAKKGFLPLGFVLTGKRFSAFLTQNSLGTTFFDNAHEQKICEFYGDIIGKQSGEHIFANRGEKKFDLCDMASETEFGNGKAIYRGEIDGKRYSLTVFIPPKYPIKIMRLECEESLNAEFIFEPILGDGIKNRGCIYTERRQKNICYKKFVSPIHENILYGFAGVYGGESGDGFKLTAEGKEITFFIGAVKTENAITEIIKKIDRAFFDDQEYEAYLFAKESTVDIFKTAEKNKNTFLNIFLPQQIYFCRFLARGSYYQSGGAYGFRDQLQDTLALSYFKKDAARTHILRCCAHQYEEGRCMHWWHGCTEKGVKTDCSDDMLWLPLAVAEYINVTEDRDILDIKVHYLFSEGLKHGEERYEKAFKTDYRESVYAHCIKSLIYADRRGKNGFILMGSCDWNDGFSNLGKKGIGESIFTTMLYIYVAEKFLPYAKAEKDILKKKITELRNTLEENAWADDRYIRAITDEGDILGVPGRGECEIDILTQSFAALCGLNAERTKKALETAFDILYDGKNNIFRLFYPPFSSGKGDIGYIRGYAEYMRENGGQYNHGALFGVLGYLKVGMTEKAKIILNTVIPTERYKKGDRYGGEIYAVAADIYGGEHGGRAGWTYYTGSAAWLFKILKEHPELL